MLDSTGGSAAGYGSVGAEAARPAPAAVLRPASLLLRRLAGGAFWSVLGSVAARALSLAAAVLVARRLGAATFGELNLVQTTAGTLQALAGFGLGATATRYLAGRYRTEPAAAGRIVSLSWLVAGTAGALATVALALAAGWVARALLGAADLAPALQLGSLLLVLGALNGAQVGVLAGLERFRLLAAAATLSGLVSIPLLLVGAAAGGMLGCVVGLVASAAIGLALHGVAVSRALAEAGIAASWRGALREWRVLCAYSLPATLSNLLLGPVTWAAAAILANQADGLREVGLFAAANQWRNAMIFVASAAGAALFPLFSDLHDNGRATAFSRTFWGSLWVTAVASIVAACALALAAPALMGAYGAEFTSASRILVLLVAAGALAAPLTVVGHAIAGAGRMWLGLWLNLVWACVLLGLAWSFRREGALGLAVAYAGAYLVHLVTSLGAAVLLVRRRAVLEVPHGAR